MGTAARSKQGQCDERKDHSQRDNHGAALVPGQAPTSVVIAEDAHFSRPKDRGAVFHFCAKLQGELVPYLQRFARLEAGQKGQHLPRVKIGARIRADESRLLVVIVITLAGDNQGSRRAQVPPQNDAAEIQVLGTARPGIRRKAGSQVSDAHAKLVPVPTQTPALNLSQRDSARVNLHAVSYHILKF
ncbi:MAG: hypothetical protein ACRD6I_07700 [Candidatus Acidiferrales bacterium]